MQSDCPRSGERGYHRVCRSYSSHIPKREVALIVVRRLHNCRSPWMLPLCHMGHLFVAFFQQHRDYDALGNSLDS